MSADKVTESAANLNSLKQDFKDGIKDKKEEEVLKLVYADINNNTIKLLEGLIKTLIPKDKFDYLKFLVSYAVSNISKIHTDVAGLLNDISTKKETLNGKLNQTLKISANYDREKIIKIIILLHTMRLLENKDNNLSRALIAMMFLTTANFVGLTGSLIFGASKLYGMAIGKPVLCLSLSVLAIVVGVVLILLVTGILLHYIGKYQTASEKKMLDNINDTKNWITQALSEREITPVSNDNNTGTSSVSIFSEKLADFMGNTQAAVMKMTQSQ